MSFENKLLQMKGMLKKQPAKKQQPKAAERPLHEDKWNRIGLELVENKFGFVFPLKIFSVSTIIKP